MHHIQTNHSDIASFIKNLMGSTPLYWKQQDSFHAFGDESFLSSTIWGSINTHNITEEQMDADDKFLQTLFKYLRENTPENWVIQESVSTTFKLYLTTSAHDSMTIQFSDHMIYLITIASGQY